jgi:hypothetical protein
MPSIRLAYIHHEMEMDDDGIWDLGQTTPPAMSSQTIFDRRISNIDTMTLTVKDAALFFLFGKISARL